MKKLYDLTYTVAMSENQLHKLARAADEAMEADENSPEWEAGLAAVRELSLRYGVKAKLKRWTMRRNADDLKANP
jgi:hypothetical protein